MISTAERLKSITDRALFEKICNAILRIKFPTLVNIIEGGINEKGQTVKGKLDAFCNIGNEEFILVEHTTDSNLRSKWLYDRADYRGKKDKPDQDDGDLIKALREVDALRADYPRARFTIYLTTNQNVSSDLWMEVLRKAAPPKATIQIIELKTLADFLDNTPEGQYLRQAFWGVTTELLSISRLKDIEKQCLEIYAQDCFIERAAVIEDWNLDKLKVAVEGSSRSLMLVLAESGYGKSTLCFNYCRARLDQGEHVLRINAAAIAASNTLIEAINHTIRQLSPGIFINGLSERLIVDAKLTIIVDDINNAAEPVRLLDKLVSWSASKDSMNSAWSGIRMICPVWPGYLAQLPDGLKKEAHYDYFRLEPPTHSEASAMVKSGLSNLKVQLSELAVEDLLANTGYDPLLISLAVTLIKPDSPTTFHQGIPVLRAFVADRIESAVPDRMIPAPKKRMLIEDLGLILVLNRSLHPTYRQMITWCSESPYLVELIDGLAARRELLFFDDNNSLCYRHDRMRDYIIKEGLVKALADMESNIEPLSDPFFARLAGQAIAETEIKSSALDCLMVVAPQAVFNALRHLQFEGAAPKKELIMKAIQRWHVSENRRHVHPIVLSSIAADLSNIEMQDIARLIPILPNTHSMIAARFRNGDAAGGIMFMESHLASEPALTYPYRDLLIEHVKAYHSSGMVRQLIAYLKTDTLPEVELKSTLLLCGYLGDQRLVDSLSAYWHRNPEKELLGYHVWAMLNCFGDETADPAFEVLDAFMRLPDEKRVEGGKPRGIRNSTLYTFTKVDWPLKASQIETLAKHFTRFDSLLLAIFHHLDHPAAIKITVDNIAANLEKAHPHSTYAIFNPGDRWDFSKNRKRLSPETTKFLLAYWQDSRNQQRRREVSLHFWAGNMDPEISVPILQEVGRNDCLFDKALWRRVLAGDKSATDDFLDQVSEKPFLVRSLHRIWSAKCKQFYRDFFTYRNADFENTEFRLLFVELLKEVPEADAAELLVEFWDEIQDELFGVQIALFIATPETKYLAAEKISKTHPPDHLFMYINQVYEFSMNGEPRLSIKRLQAIQPYLKFIGKLELQWIAESCMRDGFGAWAKQELAPHLDTNAATSIWPTAADLATRLQSDVRLDRSHFWLSSLKSDRISHEQIVSALRIFAEQINTDKEYRILGSILKNVGMREDLEILNGVDPSAAVSVPLRNSVIEGARYAIWNRVYW